MSDDNEPLARNARNEIVDVSEVIEEVVVAAGSDPIAITVTAQIGRDDVVPRGETLGDLVPAKAEIEKAVQQQERRVARRVPLEDVVRQPCREGNPALPQGPASI